ncbi:hypothetical protein WAE61_10075 [Comamonadaceae bacterium PP-2]
MNVFLSTPAARCEGFEELFAGASAIHSTTPILTASPLLMSIVIKDLD